MGQAHPDHRNSEIGVRDQLGRRIELPRAKDLSAKERSAGTQVSALARWAKRFK